MNANIANLLGLRYSLKLIASSYRHIIIILAALLSVVVAGRAKPGKRLDSPKISLVNIQVQHITLFETILHIELRVTNPNEVLIEIKGIDCDLELNGKKFASGVSDERAKIPPFHSAIVPMTIYSSVLHAFRGLATSRKTQDFHYKVAGKLHLTGELMFPAVIPFVSEGALSFEADMID